MLGKLQSEIRDWRMYNFPDATAGQQFMGVVEEVGELAHEILKEEQCIRGYDHLLVPDAKKRDAVGDIAIFLINYCDLQGWDFEKILATTWEEVAGRDWRNNPRDGVNG